jgi:hypothetical protein
MGKEGRDGGPTYGQHLCSEFDFDRGGYCHGRICFCVAEKSVTVWARLAAGVVRPHLGWEEEARRLRDDTSDKVDQLA